MSKLTFSERAWNDYIYWQSQDKKTIEKLNALPKEIQRTSFIGSGKPEPLKHDKSGYWSRRINDTDRLVYRMNGDIVEIMQRKGHY